MESSILIPLRAQLKVVNSAVVNYLLVDAKLNDHFKVGLIVELSQLESISDSSHFSGLIYFYVQGDASGQILAFVDIKKKSCVTV